MLLLLLLLLLLLQLLMLLLLPRPLLPLPPPLPPPLRLPPPSPPQPLQARMLLHLLKVHVLKVPLLCFVMLVLLPRLLVVVVLLQAHAEAHEQPQTRLRVEETPHHGLSLVQHGAGATWTHSLGLSSDAKREVHPRGIHRPSLHEKKGAQKRNCHIHPLRSSQSWQKVPATTTPYLAVHVLHDACAQRLAEAAKEQKNGWSERTTGAWKATTI